MGTYKASAIKLLVDLLIIICICLPVAVLIIWSFSDRIPWPNILPERFTLNTWHYILSQREFKGSIVMSIFISFAVSLIVMAVSIPAALAVSSYEFAGKNIVWVLLVMPLLIPSISAAIGLHSVYIRLGLTDNVSGVILSHIIPCLPYSVRILSFSFEIIGREMGEQGKSLGADTVQVLRYIYLPLLKPAIVLSSLLVFIISFSQYILTFLIGGGMVKTLPILLFPVIQNGSRAEISAYSLVFIFSAVAATMLIEKILGSKYNSKYYMSV